MGFVNDFADDVLGFDPNGGGIHDVPIVGDIVDDQLGADPGETPLEQLGSVVGTVGAGLGAAGLAGVGPAAGLNTAVTQPALQAVGLGGAPAATAAGTAAAAPAAGSALTTAGQVAGAAGAAAPLLTGGAAPAAAAPASGGGFWQNAGNIAQGIGNVAGAVGNVAGAVGAGAELYDAITGEGAEADREHARRAVADIAPLTALQQEGIDARVAAARDPRIAQSVDRLYGAQQRGSQALGTGLDTLSGIATGSDPYTQRLAQQAAAASQLGASGAGVLGSARGQRAAQTAAADVIAKRQQSAAGTLASTGRGLLGEGAAAQQLAQTPGTALASAGALRQQQRQAELNQQAQVAAAAAREPTTAETIGRVAGGLEALPTVYDQGRQGVQSLYDLFRS